MKIMTHIVAGYPNIKECKEIAHTMSNAGVSYIEIQFPFSDPIADGKTILEANTKALANGMTTEKSFKLLEGLALKTPILIMTYFNIAFSYGLEKFCKRAAKAGVYGLIIPDIPIDEEKSEHYIKLCKKYSLHPIQVISPITPPKRLQRIAKVASGFVYCVSNFGTTGERKALNPQLKKYLDRVRKYIKTPLALGFGISNESQVQTALKHADIAVIGSKVLNIYNESGKVSEINHFLASII